MEVNHRHFQNEGHALYFDCDSYQIVLYDKLRDIVKSSRQAADKDKTVNQLDLFKQYQKKKNAPEILRLEARLIKKVKLNSILTSLGYEPNPTFKSIFDENLAKKVLQYYWDFITPDKGLFILKFSEENILKQVIDCQKAEKTKLNAIETLGLAQIIEYSKNYSLRDLRTTLTDFYSQRTWQRLDKYFKQIEKITSGNKEFGFISDIENSLEVFEPYRTASLLEGEQL